MLYRWQGFLDHAPWNGKSHGRSNYRLIIGGRGRNAQDTNYIVRQTAARGAWELLFEGERVDTFRTKGDAQHQAENACGLFDYELDGLSDHGSGQDVRAYFVGRSL